MFDALLTLLRPLEAAISWPLATTHDLLATAGLAAGPAWLLAIVALVVCVRGALLPLVVRQVRLAHAAARARPALADIARRYAGRRDPESVRAQLAQTRAVRAEHGASLGCLPALVTGLTLFTLYRLLADVAAGHPVGAMTADLVASARTADVLGVTLPATLGHLGLTGPGMLVIALAAVAAGVGYASTRWLTLPNLPAIESASPAGTPEAMTADLQRRTYAALPLLTAAGLLVSAPVVPAGLVAYWAASSLWTAAQQGAIVRWAPTPGTAAYRRREQRRAGGAP